MQSTDRPIIPMTTTTEIEQARAEGFLRGYDVATSRAISRQEQGLPIEPTEDGSR